MLRLRDIMTRDVLTVGPATTLREAAELLATRHIGGAPVVDGTRLVGVVSATDILAFAASASDAPRDEREGDDGDDWNEASHDDLPSTWFAERAAEHARIADLDVVEEMEEMDDVETIGDALDRHTVAEVMTRRVMAMPPGADAITAASRLRTADVHRVLVVDGDRLLGIVTTSDITRAVADRALVQRTYVFDGRG